ncbi:hypothetical protein SNARM312S_01753 [Streptomyces narbonensis]
MGARRAGVDGEQGEDGEGRGVDVVPREGEVQEEREAADPVPGAVGDALAVGAGEGDGDGRVREEGEDHEGLDVRERGQESGAMITRPAPGGYCQVTSPGGKVPLANCPYQCR